MEHEQMTGAVVPEGWKLVPTTATPEMIKVGLEKIAFAERIGMPEYSSDDGVDMAWDAMLVAAPEAPVAEQTIKTWRERVSSEDWQSKGFAAMEAEIADLRAVLADQDKLLRQSVPDRWKDCTSPVGSVQSYIAELEESLGTAAQPQPVAEQGDLPPAEYDASMDRHYLPLPSGWEIQTKGKGSTFRILQAKTGARWLVLDEKLHEPLTAIARDVRAAIAASQQPQPTQAAQDVLAERQRQVGAEGWTPAHDDQYQNDELSLAAACYTIASDTAPQAEIPQMWPWPDYWWKPTTERRNLVKAGALILAEIERLDRAALAKKGGAA